MVESMTALILDIETVPTEAAMSAPYPEAERKYPANFKDPEKIAAWYESDRVKWTAERAKEASLNPRLGRIVCMGIRDEDGVTALWGFEPTEHAERELLHLTWDCIRRADGQLISFNGLAFDVPFFLVRSLVHGIKPTVPIKTVRDWTRRYSFGPHFDVRAVLTQWDSRTSGTLTDWATAFGIECPDKTSGADIYGLYQRGDFSAIADHCRADVTTTAALYEKVSSLYGGVA